METVVNWEFGAAAFCVLIVLFMIAGKRFW